MEHRRQELQEEPHSALMIVGAFFRFRACRRGRSVSLSTCHQRRMRQGSQSRSLDRLCDLPSVSHLSFNATAIVGDRRRGQAAGSVDERGRAGGPIVSTRSAALSLPSCMRFDCCEACFLSHQGHRGTLGCVASSSARINPCDWSTAACFPRTRGLGTGSSSIRRGRRTAASPSVRSQGSQNRLL